MQKKVWTAVIAAAAASMSIGEAAPLDPNKVEDAMAIARKIACSTVDGEAATYYWFGKAYSRRAGERDIHLFNVEGMNVRACVAAEGGYNLVSREILLYTDPVTNEVLSTWKNPWTGEEVEVLHVANDPVNGKTRPRTRSGEPYQWSGVIMGDVWHQTATVPLFYPNPLGSQFQNEVGPVYHATEMFNFFGDTEGLLDPETTSAPNVQVGWARMSDWLPWMKMAGREGVIYMHTAGKKLDSWDDLPDVLKREIRKNYPEYTAPPPLDDPRENMTSWKYYRDAAAGDIKPPKRK